MINLTHTLAHLNEQSLSIQDKMEGLRKLEKALEGFETDKEITLDVGYESVDINYLDRETTMAVMQHLALGKWERESCGESLNYIYDNFHKNLKLRLYGSQPPPSCQIVWEEVVVPASVRRTPKIVCKQPEAITQ